MKENKQRDRKIEELCAKFFVLFCFGYMLTNTFVIKFLLGFYFAGMFIFHFHQFALKRKTVLNQGPWRLRRPFRDLESI